MSQPLHHWKPPIVTAFGGVRRWPKAGPGLKSSFLNTILIRSRLSAGNSSIPIRLGAFGVNGLELRFSVEKFVMARFASLQVTKPHQLPSDTGQNVVWNVRDSQSTCIFSWRVRALTASDLFFSVGEPSGDLHASSLIRSLQGPDAAKVDKGLSYRGFGGKQMQKAGCHLDYELTNLAVVGFVEVVPKLREFFRVADIASDIFRNERPRGVLLVDFPGFNWHIAKRAKQLDIPVFYYLPPQLWAWGSWRLKKMRRYVDHVLCNLPFEPAWYAEREMQVDYVGHPFLDAVHDRPLDDRFVRKWSDFDGVQIAVLPGSRNREVNQIWPMQLEVIRELAKRHPKTRFLVACLKDVHCRWCRNLLNESDRNLDVQFFVGKTSEIIDVADCSLMKSGSVSLEMMARSTPSVVIYHASRVLYTVGRCLTNLQSMTLPNMVAGKTVMPEFLAVGRAKSATIEKTIAALDRLIGDPEERQLQKWELQRLIQKFGSEGASRSAAALIRKRLGLVDPAERVAA